MSLEGVNILAFSVVVATSGVFMISIGVGAYVFMVAVGVGAKGADKLVPGFDTKG